MTIPLPYPRRLFRHALAALAVLSLAIVSSAPARAIQDSELQELVDRARNTLEFFNNDKEMNQFRAYVPYAHALLIVPKYIKGAFWLGFAGGKGVLIRRDEATGQWTSPAFYRLFSASIGAQFGGSGSEMVLIFQTEDGLKALQAATSLKFGVDAAVAAGPMGYGVEGATTPAGSTDIAAFSRANGAFMGASLSGSTMTLKDDWNYQYYGSPVSLSDLLEGRVHDPRTEALRQTAAKFFSDNNPGSN